MTPHEVHHPRRPDSQNRDGWGMIPVLLGVAGVVVVGVLVLTGSSY